MALTVTVVGVPTPAIVTAVALAAVVSALVLTVSVDEPVVLVLVIPAIARVAAAPSPTAQVPPLSASVIVATVPTPETAAEQLLNPLSSVTLEAVAALKDAEKVTVIVSPAWREPVELVVKFVVQVAMRFATRVVAETVTAVGDVAAPIVIAAGLATVASALVLTFQRFAAGVPAAPLVTPRICRVAAALLGSWQLPPLSASVIVTVWAAPAPFAEQLLNPLVRMMVGLAGTANTEVAFGKTTVIVSPASSPPDPLGVNPTFQVARAFAARVVEVNVTAVGAVAALIVGAARTVRAVASALVATVQFAAAGEPATPLVTPRI